VTGIHLHNPCLNCRFDTGATVHAPSAVSWAWGCIIGDEILAVWVERELPLARALLDEQDPGWNGYPSGTDVCLFVLGPVYLDAVQNNRDQDQVALSEFFEKMLVHDDWAIQSDAVLTLAPWLARAASEEPRLLDRLGAGMRPTVQEMVDAYRNAEPGSETL
jgi:hypothetical protein